MKKFSEYKHVIWDWNGTLLDDVQLCCSLMNGILSKRNLHEISLDHYRSIFTFPVKEYYKKAGLNVNDDNWEILSHEFIDGYEERKHDCSLFEHSEAVLDAIREKGITQSILSAYSQNTLEETVRFFGIDKYFIKLIGLDNIYAASKLENGIRWMKDLQFKNNEVILIGDTYHDYQVAESIGADSLLMSYGHQAKDNLPGNKCLILDSLEMLLDLLEE